MSRVTRWALERRPACLSRLACAAAALLGCDPLLDGPRVTDVTAEIVSPPSGEVIIQPGPTFDITLEVVGCSTVSKIELLSDDAPVQTFRAGDKKKPVLQGDPPLEDHEWTISLSVTDLLPTSLLAKDPASRIGADGLAKHTPLTARVDCGDHKKSGKNKSADTQPVSLSVNPVQHLRSSLSGVQVLTADHTEEGSIWVATDSALHLLSQPKPGQPPPSIGPSNRLVFPSSIATRLWHFEDEIWLWKDCHSCEVNVAGTLYLARRGPLRRVDSTQLSCAPAAVAPMPADPTRLLIAHADCSTGAEASTSAATVRILDRDTLRELSTLHLGSRHEPAGFIGPLAGPTANSGDQVHGLARHGSDKVRLFLAEPGSLGWPDSDIQTDGSPTRGIVDPQRQWAAWVSKHNLYFLPLDHTPLTATRVSQAPIGSREKVIGLQASNAGELALYGRHLVQVFAFGHTVRRWQHEVKSPEAILSVAALPRRRWAVLTEQANLFVLDHEGKQLLEQGELGRLGEAVDSLAVTGDGLIHYAINDLGRSWVVSFSAP